MHRPLAHGFGVSRALVACLTLVAMSLVTTNAPRALYGQAVYEPPRPVGDAWKNPRDYRKFSADKNQIMLGRKPIPDRDQFIDYYKSSLIARLTDPAHYGKDFPAIRKEMQRDLMTKVPSIRSDLIDLFVAELGVIAKGNYHPASRVNAIILLGSLNTSERTPAGKPAVPYKAVLGELNTTYSTDTEPLGIRLAALVGVLRHVESDWLLIANGGQPQVEEVTRTALRATATAIIKTDTAPDGVQQRAWDYFRARSMDLFGSLVSYTPTKADLGIIVAMASQQGSDMLLRSRAVFALGRQKYGVIADVDGDAVVGSLVAYLADACQQAIDDVEMLRKANQKRKAAGGAGGGLLGGGGGVGGGVGGDSGGGSSPGGGMFGGSGGGAGGGGVGGIEAFELDMLRRQILYHVFSAKRAIDGTREADFPGAKHFDTVKVFAKFEAQLELLEDAANDVKLDTDSLIDSIRGTRGLLSEFRGKEVEEAPVAPVDPLFN